MISERRIRLEAAKRTAREQQAINQAEALVNDLFPLQVDFIRDASKRKTLVCGRRAGKTHSLSRYLVKTALENPDSNSLYVALTKPYAIALLWVELTKYCKALGLDVKYDNLRHVIHFGNGAKIIFGGVSSKDEREKLRGFAYHLVVCDEVGSFGPYLGYLLEDILSAALLDFDGVLVLAGTPSPQAAGTFYDSAHDTTGTWKNWHWTVLENPRIPQWQGKDNWKQIAKDFLAQVEARTPSVKFKREYLGSWIRDVDSLLYLLDPIRNTYAELPDEPMDYVIGADTGFNDASAIVVLGASRITNRIYVVDEWSRSGVLIDALAKELAGFGQRYRNAVMVIDPANKQLVESMRQIYNLPLEAADKLGKRAHIDLLNSALHLGNVKFKHKSPTFEQMSILEWNTKRTAESEAFPADLADSMLYAYTRIYNWNNLHEAPKQMTERDRQNEDERKMIAEAVKRASGKSDDPFAYDEPNWGES